MTMCFCGISEKCWVAKSINEN